MVELKLSQVLEENSKFRIDSQYFSHAALEAEQKIVNLESGYTTLGDVAACFRKGIFDIKSDNYTENGVPFVRISNLRGGIIDDTDIAHIPEEIHEQENKTALGYGDLILSKTAYGAAAFVNLASCNVSQDTIAVRLKPEWKKRLSTAYVSAFLNSSYGLILMNRQFQGNVQMHLSLPDGEKIKIPLLSDILQQKVYKCFTRSLEQAQVSQNLYFSAENLLLDALGLRNWQPPRDLTYQQTSSAAFAAGRLDAQYFHPRVQHILKLLRRGELTVGDVAPLRKEYFDPSQAETFQYIEIGDVTGIGEVTSSLVASSETPDRATWHVRQGDIITSTVRPIRRLSALINPEQDGFVCSSGFAVLQPCRVPPEVLLVYLRLPMIAELMDLHTTASLYPAISVPDILNIPFAPLEKSDDVVRSVQASRAARVQSKRLLEAAKRAVEIAIEDSEAAALRFLEEINAAEE